jgi:hypothetical protein
LTGSVHLREEIAVVRKKIQRIAKQKLLVLDETHCRLSEVPTHSVVLPGESPTVTVTDTGAYAARIDMIGCIHTSGALPAFTLTPVQRQQEGVRGLTTNQLIHYIADTLGPAVRALGQSSFVLILDNSRIHNRRRIIDEFSTAGVVIEDIMYIPAQTASRQRSVPRLERASSHARPLSLRRIPGIMTREFEGISKAQIEAHYRHCGFMRGCSAYFCWNIYGQHT